MSEITIHVRKRIHFLLGEAVPPVVSSWYLRMKMERLIIASQRAF